MRGAYCERVGDISDVAVRDDAPDPASQISTRCGLLLTDSSHVQAAGLSVTYHTAYHALVTIGEGVPRQTLGVTGRREEWGSPRWTWRIDWASG
jgi:NADPH:quinone reductase-like Zn-dependent oxidoreductase